MHAQLLTNALPAPASVPSTISEEAQQAAVPDDPSRQVLPIARPEPLPAVGVPVRWTALQQSHVGDVSTLTGEVVLYYKNYVIHADKIIYHHADSKVEAEGHLQLEGGPNDAVLTATHGEINLQDNTAAFYDVTGTFGVRHMGKTQI